MPEEKKQHTSPCATCAFRRDSPSDMRVPGTLGGSPAYVYVGQLHGPFWIPCHTTYDQSIKDEDAKKRNPCNRECAGGAIMRANTGDDQRLPAQLLHLPPDKENVFATYAEFLAHHWDCTVEQAEGFLKRTTPDMLLGIEMYKQGAKRLDPTTKKEI